MAPSAHFAAGESLLLLRCRLNCGPLPLTQSICHIRPSTLQIYCTHGDSSTQIRTRNISLLIFYISLLAGCFRIFLQSHFIRAFVFFIIFIEIIMSKVLISKLPQSIVFECRKGY